MYTQNAPTTSSDFDLRASLVVVRRRRWTLILVIFVVLALGAVSSYRKSPVYQATATALLKAGAADSVLTEQLSSDPERRVQNEAQLITSLRTANAVEDRLGFGGSVTVAAGGVDDVLEITATGGDPERAALIANTYADVHRELRSADNREAVVSAKREVRRSLNEVEASAAANSQQFNELNRQRAVTADATVLAALDAQITENQQIQQTLSNSAASYSDQLSELETQQGLIASRPPIEILAPAAAPSSPISPNHRQDLTVVLVIGLLLGIAVVFVQEHLDDTIRDIADVARAAGDLPSLAVVPLHEGDPDNAILTATKPMSHTAESYRSLRTSVEFLALEKRMQTIQITSAQPGEGKTTTVVNLAVAFSQAGESVVAVDCDLRRPRLHEFFGLDRHVGFTSVLLHEAQLDDVLRATPEFPNLSILSAGPLAPNPSELLGSEGFAEIIRKLAADYSVVLLDSPPVLPVTDAVVLSRVADATIVVTCSGISSKRRVQRAISSLRQVSAPLVGTVLGSAPHEIAYGYVDYGYVAYGHSSSTKNGVGRGRSRARARARTET